MRRVLVATLGESPGVVTEAIDALTAQGTRVEAVSVLTTKEEDAQSALALLYEHLPEYYGGAIKFDQTFVSNEYRDVDTSEAVLEFMEKACSFLRAYRMQGAEVHVCIAGGRKTMSTLMALAVQFYGAASLFHVTVEDPEVEEMGQISRLRNLSREEQVRYLHPPVGQIRLVRLPFLGLFPLMGEVMSALQGKEVRREVKELLEANSLLKAQEATELGRLVLRILEQVEALPDPRMGECDRNIKDEPKEQRETEKWVERLCRVPFVTRIETISWREGQPKVKAAPPDHLLVFVPGRRVRGIGLRLTTTARTEGQLEAVRRYVEGILEGHV